MIDTFSSKVIDLRHQAGMTQAELARRLHLSRSSINSWESAASYPSIESLIALAQVFHVSTDYLLGVTNSKSIVLDKYGDHEQELVFRLLRYFDEVVK